MLRGSITRMISAGVVLLSLAWIIMTLKGGGIPDFDARPHQAAGMVMAQQALKLHKPGGKIIVFRRDTAMVNNPAADAQFETFAKTLKKANVAIDSVQLLQVDLLAPFLVPPGDFAEAIRRSADNDVIVSFMGPPVFDEGHRAMLPEKGGAQIVAFCPGRLVDRVNLQELFRDGLLQAAVVSKKNPPVNPKPAGALQGWFDQYFQEVNAANVASLFPSNPIP